MASVPPFDRDKYKEAIAELRKAEEAADQADAILRDLQCRDGADIKRRNQWHGITETSLVLSAMVTSLETWTCDECGVLMLEHAGQCAANEVTHG